MAMRSLAGIGGVGGVALLASSFDPFLAGLSQGIEERRWV